MALLVLFNVAPDIRPDLASPTDCSNVATLDSSIRPQGPTLAEDLAYLQAMEGHLREKALKVLKRFTAESCSVDLNLELDAAQQSVTTYQPGERVLLGRQEKRDGANYIVSQNWEPTGRWVESTDVRPRIKSMRVCVTIPQRVEIDNDHLYRCLSYELGLDLQRGDLLQLARR